MRYSRICYSWRVSTGTRLVRYKYDGRVEYQKKESERKIEGDMDECQVIMHTVIRELTVSVQGYVDVHPGLK